jgi:hypothetical protein
VGNSKLSEGSPFDVDQVLNDALGGC